MTTEELRNLDAEIHRKVMGGECDRAAPSFVHPNPVDWCEKSPFLHLAPGVPGWVKIPHYSTDISAAWLVVEKLTDGEYVKVRCEQSHYHGDYCSVTASDPVYHDGTELVKRNAYGVWGETMPLAICRAALLSTEMAK